jgi:hypothetical protein
MSSLKNYHYIGAFEDVAGLQVMNLPAAPLFES